MKRYLLLFLVLYLDQFCQAYKIVTLPSSETNNDEISLKVFFSTKTVSEKRTVTTTITQSVFPTCYATEPGIVPCQRKRDFGDSNEEEFSDESHEPKVTLNGVETAWETFITPSRVSILLFSRANKSFSVHTVDRPNFSNIPLAFDMWRGFVF